MEIGRASQYGIKVHWKLQFKLNSFKIDALSSSLSGKIKINGHFLFQDVPLQSFNLKTAQININNAYLAWYLRWWVMASRNKMSATRNRTRPKSILSGWMALSFENKILWCRWLWWSRWVWRHNRELQLSCSHGDFGLFSLYNCYCTDMVLLHKTKDSWSREDKSEKEP